MPKFETFEIERGSIRPIDFTFKWDDDGSARDVSATTVKLRVYSDQGVTLLFPEKTLTNGTATNQKRFVPVAIEVDVQAKAYYAELDLAGDILHGTALVVGS
jgi:hypothetical protein